MAADTHPADPTDPAPTPSDAHAIGRMGWVMPVWLIAFLVVVVFGIISYLFGWWYHRTHSRAGSPEAQRSALVLLHSATSQTRIVS
jgi:hypothetical protein